MVVDFGERTVQRIIVQSMVSAVGASPMVQESSPYTGTLGHRNFVKQRTAHIEVLKWIIPIPMLMIISKPFRG